MHRPVDAAQEDVHHVRLRGSRRQLHQLFALRPLEPQRVRADGDTVELDLLVPASLRRDIEALGIRTLEDRNASAHARELLKDSRHDDIVRDGPLPPGIGELV